MPFIQELPEIDVSKLLPEYMSQRSNIVLTWHAVRSSSAEEEDTEGNTVLAAPIMALWACSASALFKSISSLELIVLSGISGSHSGDGEDSEDVLHKHVEGLFGKRSLWSCLVVVDVL